MQRLLGLYPRQNDYLLCELADLYAVFLRLIIASVAKREEPF